MIYEPQIRKGTKKYKTLWHVDEDNFPQEGRVIVAQLEEGKNVIIRFDSDVCTDEIVAWAYLDELI